MSVWLVTGASSGLGSALARHVLAAGHQVVATARDTADLRDLCEEFPGTALPATLDLTDTTTIHRAVAAAHDRFGRIDVLVNNAGYGYVAAVEEGRADAVARLFATTVHGPATLITAALPGMRARAAGTIVNVSSIGARAPLPGGGYYAAAKAALEGLTGALRQEIAPLGLHAMVVEPGSFRTDFRGRSADRSPTRIPAYDEVLGRTGGGRLGPQRGDPARAAAAVLRAVEDPRPPALLLLGSDALDGFRATAAREAEDVARFADLTRSTDL